jgi:polysaccharide export outer membrane protein
MTANAYATDNESHAAEINAYTIHAGDLLSISVWKEPDLQQDVLVRPDGGISFPLLGDLPAKGKSVATIAADIRDKLQHYIPDPVVNVAVKQLLGNKIFVIGKVNRPGELVLNQPLDVVQALSAAGGMTPFADVGDILILRRNEAGKQTAIKFDYGQVEEGQDLDSNIFLAGGDVVIVP